MNFKKYITNFINKYFNKKTMLQQGTIDEYSKKVESIDDLELAKNFEENASKNLKNEIDKYSSIDDIYDYPLDTKISFNYSIKLAKEFLKTIDMDFSSNIDKIFDNKNKDAYLEIGESNSKEQANVSNPNHKPVRVYIPVKGDIRDLYSLVHELTHTLDIENGDTTTRRILGEVAPQCMERMLDEYLLNMSEEKRKQYNFDKKTLIEDINKRRFTTFISRYRNAHALNVGSKDREKDSRYVLAQLYSTKFMKYSSKERKDRIKAFIKSVNDDNFEKAHNDFDLKIERNKEINRNDLVRDCVYSVEKLIEKTSQDEKNSIYLNDKYKLQEQNNKDATER